jgi:hypothetical protein
VGAADPAVGIASAGLRRLTAAEELAQALAQPRRWLRRGLGGFGQLPMGIALRLLGQHLLPQGLVVAQQLVALLQQRLQPLAELGFKDAGQIVEQIVQSGDLSPAGAEFALQQLHLAGGG